MIARTSGNATEWIVTGDPLPADEERVAAMFGPWQATPQGRIAPLLTAAGRSAGTVWLRDGRVTIAAVERARWGVRLGLLLWIAGWLLWLLRRR